MYAFELFISSSLHKSQLQKASDHISPLQSWGPELQHFTRLRRRPIPEDCDVVVEEPTFVMKIDAGRNYFVKIMVQLHIFSIKMLLFSCSCQHVSSFLWFFQSIRLIAREFVAWKHIFDQRSHPYLGIVHISVSICFHVRSVLEVSHLGSETRTRQNDLF